MGIGEYFMSVVVASVITSLIGILFGDDKAALSKGINSVCSLFLLCVIAVPISSLIAGSKDKFDIGNVGMNAFESAASAENALYSSVGEISCKMIEEALGDHIAERVGINGSDFEVRAEVSVADGEVILSRVVICLYSGARWCDPRALTDAVGELTEAECLIINGE
jgi:hypothetical protein